MHAADRFLFRVSSLVFSRAQSLHKIRSGVNWGGKNMIQTVSSPTENAFSSSSNSIETPRRRSTFYVPLTISTATPVADESSISISIKPKQSKDANHDNFKTERPKRFLDRIYRSGNNERTFDWNIGESGADSLMASHDVELRTGIKRTASASTGMFAGKNDRILSERPIKSNSTTEINNRNKIKRYGIVLNGSVNLDDDEKLHINDENQCHDDDGDEQKSPSSTSTPIKMLKSRSRSNILCLPDKSFQLSPLKEKSKTLPQNLSPKVMTSASATNITSHTNSSTFPPKYSFLLKSSPKISLNYTFDAVANGATITSIATTTTTASPANSAVTTASPHAIDKKSQSALSPASTSSPRKALSFIRRAHSTKLSRSNSLLKSLTTATKGTDQSADQQLRGNRIVTELSFDRFEECFRSDNFCALIKEMFLLRDAADAVAAAAAATSNSNGGLATSTTAVNTSKSPTDNDKGDDDEVHSGKYYTHKIIIKANKTL